MVHFFNPTPIFTTEELITLIKAVASSHQAECAVVHFFSSFELALLSATSRLLSPPLHPLPPHLLTHFHFSSSMFLFYSSLLLLTMDILPPLPSSPPPSTSCQILTANTAATSRFDWATAMKAGMSPAEWERLGTLVGVATEANQKTPSDAAIIRYLKEKIKDPVRLRLILLPRFIFLLL